MCTLSAGSEILSYATVNNPETNTTKQCMNKIFTKISITTLQSSCSEQSLILFHGNSALHSYN